MKLSTVLMYDTSLLGASSSTAKLRTVFALDSLDAEIQAMTRSELHVHVL